MKYRKLGVLLLTFGVSQADDFAKQRMEVEALAKLTMAATLPKGSTAWFINAVSKEGLIVSSDFEEKK